MDRGFKFYGFFKKGNLSNNNGDAWNKRAHYLNRIVSHNPHFQLLHNLMQMVLDGPLKPEQHPMWNWQGPSQTRCHSAHPIKFNANNILCFAECLKVRHQAPTIKDRYLYKRFDHRRGNLISMTNAWNIWCKHKIDCQFYSKALSWLEFTT